MVSHKVVPRSLSAVAVTTLLISLSACGGASSNTAGTGSSDSLSAVKVALVSGGPHPYFQPWVQGGKDAKSDFGLGGVTFNETAAWDQSKQNDVIDSLAANGDNAFGIFGVSPTDINTTFKKLKSSGIATGSLASCPAGENEADFCLSTDVESAAYKAAKATIEAMGGKGVLVHLTGNNVDSNTQRRIAGVKRAVTETNGAVSELPDVTDIDKDLTTSQRAVADLLAAKGSQITGIVSTAYNPAVAAESAVSDAKLNIKLVAIDDDPTILKAISAGSVYATVAQNPVGQAYVGSWVLGQLASKACTMKQPGATVDSGSFLVTEENAATYDAERKAATTKLKSQFSDSLLSCK